METENTILNSRIIINCRLSFEVSFHQQLRHFSSCPNVRFGRNPHSVHGQLTASAATRFPKNVAETSVSQKHVSNVCSGFARIEFVHWIDANQSTSKVGTQHERHEIFVLQWVVKGLVVIKA